MTSIVDRIADRIPNLPKKLAQAARFAVDHPDLVAIESMRSMAQRCQVSTPTLARLAQELGYSRYSDLRSGFQEQLLGGGFGHRASALSGCDPADGIQGVIRQISDAARQNIKATLSSNDPTVWRTMAVALRDCRTCHVLGSGAVNGLALIMSGSGTMVVPGMRASSDAAATSIELVSEVGPEDVVLVLALAPYARRSIEAMRYARQRGAQVFALTDKRSSPAAVEADLTLIGPSSSPHYYPSMIGVVLLIETLLAAVVAVSDGSAVDRIRRIETLRRDSGAYLVAD